MIKFACKPNLEKVSEKEQAASVYRTAHVSLGFLPPTAPKIGFGPENMSEF